MKILIIEDDNNVIRLLERIIEDRELGQLIGYVNDGTSGLNEISRLKPDIVLVDLLMPGKDGISLVKEAKGMYPDVFFIMISQVSSKDMIGKSYQSGIEYYISKPINAIEVESVIRKVKDKINMDRKLSQIQSLFFTDNDSRKEQENNNKADKIKVTMQKIGITGEAGSQDIYNIVKYLVDNKKSMSDYTVRELCSKFTEQPKTMEQRIRRTATVGMINLANIGIEDYMNETFTEYSTGLYNFEQIKTEMDYIRGKSKKRGKVNLKKFLDGMVFYCSNTD
jgi:two-component system response regulator YcbB